MAESSLSMTYSDLMNAVSSFLGHGSDYSSLSTALKTKLNGIIKSGLRRFYNPPITPEQKRRGEKNAHQWGFFNVSTSLTTTDGQNSDDLPDDFGSIITEFIYDDDSTGRNKIRITSYGNILKMRQESPDSEGAPVCAAIIPEHDGTTESTRQVVHWFPEPDAAYTIRYQYRAIPVAISESSQYPYGAQEHGETIKEACLSVAEQQEEDAIGIHTELFYERLDASISLDRRMHPFTFGKNLDRSDVGRRDLPAHGYGTYDITYPGVI